MIELEKDTENLTCDNDVNNSGKRFYDALLCYLWILVYFLSRIALPVQAFYLVSDQNRRFYPMISKNKLHRQTKARETSKQPLDSQVKPPQTLTCK